MSAQYDKACEPIDDFAVILRRIGAGARIFCGYNFLSARTGVHGGFSLK